jgi:hypothetical protein
VTEATTLDRPLDPEEAMTSALEAEQQALATVKECEREAAELVESARQRARSIAERTDQRIRDLHVRCVRATADRVDAMVEEDARESEVTAHEESAAQALAAAVARLAARLTGEAEER